MLLHAEAVAVCAAEIGITAIARIVDAPLPDRIGYTHKPAACRLGTFLEHQPTSVGRQIAERQRARRAAIEAERVWRPRRGAVTIPGALAR